MSSDSHQYTVTFQGLAKSITCFSRAAFPASIDPTISKSSRCTALWDTGATGTCVSDKLASKLCLESFGETIVQHAAGQSLMKTYLVDIILPLSSAKSSKPALTLVNVVATEFLAGQDIDIIIGMDIISSGDFALTHRGGNSTFSFSTPSFYHIDFKDMRF